MDVEKELAKARSEFNSLCLLSLAAGVILVNVLTHSTTEMIVMSAICCVVIFGGAKMISPNFG